MLALITLPNNELVNFQPTDSGATDRQSTNGQSAKCQCADRKRAHRECTQ
jgi:hypothetical protein